MTYKVQFLPAAIRQIGKLPTDVRRRIVAKAESLAGNPRPPDCVKLAGLDSIYRVRVGDFRIVYQIHDKILMVMVVRVAHRRDVYRGL